MSTEIESINNHGINDFFWFAIVVDGDYAGKIGISKNPSPALAGLRSNPTMIEMSPEQALEVSLGWIHNGTTFVIPEE